MLPFFPQCWNCAFELFTPTDFVDASQGFLKYILGKKTRRQSHHTKTSKLSALLPRSHLSGRLLRCRQGVSPQVMRKYMNFSDESREAVTQPELVNTVMKKTEDPDVSPNIFPHGGVSDAAKFIQRNGDRGRVKVGGAIRIFH